MAFNPLQKYNQPQNKRPRIDNIAYKQIINENISKCNTNKNGDPFDDCFTGDELLELELLATQVENKNFNGSCNEDRLDSNSSAVIPDATKFDNKFSSKQVNQLQTLVEQKSGEVRLLRDKVSDLEKLLHFERQTRLADEQSRKDERSKREIELSKTVESCKDQLEFKNAELLEAYNIIKNLEMKNKELLSSSKSFHHFKFPCEGDELSQTRIRTVKPESPQVHVKKKLVKVKTISNKENLLETRRKCIITPHPLQETLILPSKHFHFYIVSTFFIKYNRLRSSDVCSAIQRLLSSSKKDNSTAGDALVIINPILCALTLLQTSDSSSNCCSPQCCCEEFEAVEPSNANVSDNFFQVFFILLHSIEELKDSIKVADIYRIILLYINKRSNIESIIKLLEEVVTSSIGDVEIFCQILEHLVDSHDCDNISLFDVIRHCIPNNDVMERLLRRKENSESVLVKLCRKEVDADTGKDYLIISKVIQAISSIICHCDVILSKVGCPSDIFDLIASILLRLIDEKEERLSLVCLYSFYSYILCFENELNFVSDRWKYLHFAKVREFAEKTPKAPWKDELIRILQEVGS